MLDDNGEFIKCAKCGKICYTLREAQGVLNIVRKRKHNGRRNRKRIPVRLYLCPDCSYYHTTHVKDRDSKNTPARRGLHRGAGWDPQPRTPHKTVR